MKRSELKRRTPLSHTGVLGLQSHARLAVSEPKPAAGPRQRKCAQCRVSFVPSPPGAKVCSPDCAAAYALAIKAKAERKEAKAARAADKQRLEEFKPLGYFLKKTEAACNEFVRARDPDICISCGVTYSSAWQAGHYISVGANPTLRFNEDNIHKQCIQCNMFKGSNATEYRIGLVKKIGVERVEWLESWHSTVKMTRESAREIEAYYKAKLKELKGNL